MIQSPWILEKVDNRLVVVTSLSTAIFTFLTLAQVQLVLDVCFVL